MQAKDGEDEDCHLACFSGGVKGVRNYKGKGGSVMMKEVGSCRSRLEW